MELAQAPGSDERIDLFKSIPYIALHVGALVGWLWFPPTWEVFWLVVGLYYLRMFGITAGYHRYFAHRGYKTGRVFQFILALLGTMASQKGVLWWSGLHRHHHRFSDMPEDIHSPKRGFWWSHHGWILCRKYEATPASQLREFKDYPEILFLNRYWAIGPLGLAVVLYLIGGASWAFWGTVVSTVILYHGTFTINSLAHVWGSRRYETTDTSRNNFFLSLVTMGEGWHNNHHHYQSTANNGFFWWEVDFSYYILKMLSWFGVVWDLRTPPAWVLQGQSKKYPLVVPDLVGLQAELANVAALRAQTGVVGAGALIELRARIGKAAAELAQKAAATAQAASHLAADAQPAARGLKDRALLGAAEVAQKAAALAREAETYASEVAAELRTKVAETWAETAKGAAAQAAAAAEKVASSPAAALARS